jgi:SAM-dependent methyltransferase
MTPTPTTAQSGGAAAARCPACDDGAAARTLEGRESMYGSGERFTYAECAGCGTVRLVDPPDDLAPYYPRDYYSVADDPEQALGRPPARQVATVLGRSALGRRRLLARLAERVAPLRQVRTLMSIYGAVANSPLPQGRPPRVLDVGTGSGALVYALSLAGVRDVEGIDPFGPGDRVFDTGARLSARELDAVDRDDWDLVMFHHSLEHVREPKHDLDQAAARLAPGGSILVRMPTVSSWAFEHYGADWVQLDPPRHLVLFSRRGVELLAARCGLRVRSVVDDSTAFQFWGSEQLRLGVPLMSPTSHMVAPRRSPFSVADLARWGQRSRRLNAQGRGDQAAWVLEPAGAP